MSYSAWLLAESLFCRASSAKRNLISTFWRIVELDKANKLLYHTNIHGIITEKTNRSALGDGTDGAITQLISYSFKDLNGRLLGPVRKELHCAVSGVLQEYQQ